MDGGAFGKAFDAFFNIVIILAIIAPLGIWKLIELIVLVCQHVHWN